MLVRARSRTKTRPRDWHRQSSNSLSHTGLGSSKLAVERGPGLETGTINLPIRCLTLAHARQSSQSSEDQASRLAPSIFQIAISHWLVLIKARSRARTRPRDWHHQSPNSLSHTGSGSSKLAVERGPGLETGTINLPIRCLTLACAHQSSQSSQHQASRLAPPIFQFAVSYWLMLIKARSRARTRPRDQHPPISQFAVSHWHVLIKARSRARTRPRDWHHQTSNSLSHTGFVLIKARSRARTRPRDWAPSIFQFAVSHWLMLIKARNRARTKPRDWHRQSSNSLSHTGLCSSKLAVERGPSLETGTINLPLRCLTLAYVHQSSQSSEDQASRLAPSISQFAV